MIVEAYLRIGSIKETQQAFLEKYPKMKSPAKRFIQSLVEKLRKKKDSVQNVKKQRPKFVRMPEAVSNIHQRIFRSHKSQLEDYPSKSVYHEHVFRS